HDLRALRSRAQGAADCLSGSRAPERRGARGADADAARARAHPRPSELGAVQRRGPQDRKSTRLNSSHVSNSYAVFCLKKKTLALIQKISRHLLAINWVMIPYVTLIDEADITDLEACREHLHEEHVRFHAEDTRLPLLL